MTKLEQLYRWHENQSREADGLRDGLRTRERQERAAVHRESMRLIERLQRRSPESGDTRNLP